MATKIKQWVSYEIRVPLSIIVPEEIQLDDIASISNHHGELTIVMNDGKVFDSSNCEIHDWEVEDGCNFESPSGEDEPTLEHGDEDDEDFTDPWS